MSASSRDSHRSLLDGLAAPDLDFRLTPRHCPALLRPPGSRRSRTKGRKRLPATAARAET